MSMRGVHDQCLVWQNNKLPLLFILNKQLEAGLESSLVHGVSSPLTPTRFLFECESAEITACITEATVETTHLSWLPRGSINLDLVITMTAGEL